MNSQERNNIAAFIEYNNIIRPVEYPLLALPFISTILVFLFGRFSISPPDKMEPIILYIGLFISVFLLIAGIVIRKRVLRYKEEKPGECLYLAQMILYIYCMIGGLLLAFIGAMGEYGVDTLPRTIFIIVTLSGVTVAVGYLRVRRRITKGYYMNRDKLLSEKMIAFSTSATCLALYIISFQIARRLIPRLGYAVLVIVLVEATSVFALIYYLKLKYAKEYGLEEYLPKRPHPSPYTGWE